VTIDQIVILFCGVSTVYLSQDPRSQARKWACVVGLAAAPAWLWTSWQHAQWGIFISSVIFALGWFRGFWHFWVKGRPA